MKPKGVVNEVSKELNQMGFDRDGQPTEAFLERIPVSENPTTASSLASRIMASFVSGVSEEAEEENDDPKAETDDEVKQEDADVEVSAEEKEPEPEATDPNLARNAVANIARAIDPVRIGLVKNMGANTKILEEAERQGLNLGDGTDVDTLTRQLR